MQPPTHSPLTPTAAHGAGYAVSGLTTTCSLGFSCRAACSTGSEKYTMLCSPIPGSCRGVSLCQKLLQPSTPRASPGNPAPLPSPDRRALGAGPCVPLHVGVSHLTTCIYGSAASSHGLALFSLLSGCVRLPIHLLKDVLAAPMFRHLSKKLTETPVCRFSRGPKFSHLLGKYRGP